MHDEEREAVNPDQFRSAKRPKGRSEKTVLPCLKFFVALVRDELKIKYAGTRRQKYASCPTEAAAIYWLKKEMGWTQTIPERMPT